MPNGTVMLHGDCFNNNTHIIHWKVLMFLKIILIHNSKNSLKNVILLLGISVILIYLFLMI